MSALAFRQVETGGLPIYRRDDAERSLFYAPGFLVVATPMAADVLARELALADPSPGPATDLRRHAAAAQRVQARSMTEIFQPVCLTLYLHNECNLRCPYCFAEAKATRGTRLEPPSIRLGLPAIRAAARLVAANCHARGLPMTLVCHGGGEPGLHMNLLKDAVETVEAVAAEAGSPLFRTIATNGALPATSMAWIAQRFNRVGLSCDGPPDVQASQRPVPGSRNAAAIERTAALVREQGTRLHVRVTVTPQTVERQEEIAEYLCRVLQPAEIHVEPVYAAGRAAAGRGSAWSPDDADRFVAGFLAGQRVAERHGVPWRSSGSRPGELHGPYCNVFRDVLNLIPGGAATGCFLATTSDAAGRRRVAIGWHDDTRFGIDPECVVALRQRLATPSAACAPCFNRHHCARACPDACELDGPPLPDRFLCRVRRRLAEAEIDALADRLWQAYTGADGCIGQAMH